MNRLYMYDVRGIQNYIFRTNKVKEIIGASMMVEDLILRLFERSADKLNLRVKSRVTHQNELLFSFTDEDNLDAEVLYYGGGNLLVLYHDELKANKVSRLMCIDLVKETYSLQLAVASVEAQHENSYKEDYQKLRKEMERVKVNMPMSTPVSGFPITLNDPQTGFPFSEYAYDQKMTYESFRKRHFFEKHRLQKQIPNIENFGSKDGESLIAVVHIDGNEMGKRIRDKMSKVTSYHQAANVSRGISDEIKNLFTDKALKTVQDKVSEFCTKAEIKDKDLDEAFREIIHAGDDITFVCNARIAMACVKEFMSVLENDGRYSACAGMYITHTHFPFARAYEYCEQLCASAKSLSRMKSGNYIDFHINYSGILNDIDDIRDKYYCDMFKHQLIARPYHIGKALNDENIYEMSQLFDMLKRIDRLVIARNQVKSLRESFYKGEGYLKEEILRVNSRLPEEDKLINIDYKVLFDAIDIMDLKWGDVHG